MWIQYEILHATFCAMNIQCPHCKSIVLCEAASPGLFCLQPWDKNLRLLLQSATIETVIKNVIQTPSMKSFKSTLLPRLVGLELHTSEFGSKQLQLITQDVWKYFSYLSTPIITQKQPFPLLPRLQSNKELYYVVKGPHLSPGRRPAR